MHIKETMNKSAHSPQLTAYSRQPTADSRRRRWAVSGGLLAVGGLLLALSCHHETSREYFRDGLESAMQGDSFLAVRRFGQAIERDRSFAAAYYARGMIFMGNKRPGRALLDFQTAVGLDSSSSDLFFDIGDAEQHLGNCRPAIASYLKSLQLDPNRKDVFLECGICHAALGETPAAIDDFSVVIAGDTTAPALAAAYHDRGALEERTGSHEMAIRDLEQSLKIDPDNSETQADLGFACLAVGRKAEARTMFLSALQNRDALPDRGRRVVDALNDPGSNP